MSIVNFFFDYRSPYAYLAHCELQRMEATLSYHPFDIRDLMKQVGNVPTTITCKAKRRYVQEDLRRWVEHYNVPFQRHSALADIDFRQLLRATLLARDHGVVA